MISEQQKKILAFPYTDYDYIICDGAIRSGKTSLIMVAYVDWAMRNYNEQDFIIMGNSVRTVERNIINPYTALAYTKKRYDAEYKRGDHVLTVKAKDRTNRFNVFGANNEKAYEAVQGLTAAGALIDEVALCNERAFNTAIGRLSVDGAKTFFSTNPSYPLHWFNQDWILKAEELNALYLPFTMDDNPSLSDDTKERLKRQYHGVFYERYILGKWVVAEGLVYQFDDPSEYTCSSDEAWGWIEDREGNIKPGNGYWYISIDYGITNPFAAILWRVTPEKAYAVKEYYFDSRKLNRRRTDREHYEAVRELAGDLLIQEIIIDPSANSFKEEIWRDGRFDVTDANNSVSDGIPVTDQMLHDGSVKISEECTNLLKELQLYRWDDKAVGDKPIKEYDHACDALRYMCNTVLRFDLRDYA